ncbi:MAG: hypothetical protein Q7V31_16065 [Parvibaculum sp.]|nr:hypothetical protein [Parvibaculum sp.]
MASEIIGLGECINCDATVEFKMNVAGRAFYRCNGSADPKRRACGLEVKAFGSADTAKIVATLKKESENAVKAGREARGKSAANRKPEPAADNEPAADAERERADDLAGSLLGR